MAVKKGQVLARLRTNTLDIRLQSALASHQEAHTRHQQASKDLERIKVLFQKELVTQKESDDAVAEEGALRQRLLQLQAEIQQVRDELAKSRVMAPFDGWVTAEFTEVGQWFRPAARLSNWWTCLGFRLKFRYQNDSFEMCE